MLMHRSVQRQTTCMQVLMDAGDLVMMHGPARHEWQHGIPAAAQDAWHGREIRQRSVRTSLTFRALDRDAP